MKSKSIIIPSEYVDLNNNLIKTIMTGRDKKNNLYAICKAKDNSIIIIEEQDLLTNYDITLNGKKIETPEYEVHRDEELDVFKSFQENAMKEVSAKKDL